MKRTPKIYFFMVAIAFVVCASMQTVLAQVPDQGTPGPLAVTREEYNFGDTAFVSTDFPGPVELHASNSALLISHGPGIAAWNTHWLHKRRLIPSSSIAQ